MNAQVTPEMAVQGAHVRFCYAGIWKSCVVDGFLPQDRVAMIRWQEGGSRLVEIKHVWDSARASRKRPYTIMRARTGQHNTKTDDEYEWQ